MQGSGIPAVLIVPTAPGELEVLDRARRGSLGVGEGVGHAHPFERLLLDAVDHGGLRQPRQLQHGRGDVDQMVELVADLPSGGDPLGPPDHRAIGGAPIGGVELGVRERRDLRDGRPNGGVIAECGPPISSK